MNNISIPVIEFSMDKEKVIYEDKKKIFKELIIEYLLSKLKSEKFNDA